MNVGIAISYLIAGAFIYFIPCLIAGSRHHPHGGGIFVANNKRLPLLRGDDPCRCDRL